MGEFVDYAQFIYDNWGPITRGYNTYRNWINSKVTKSLPPPGPQRVYPSTKRDWATPRVGRIPYPGGIGPTRRRGAPLTRGAVRRRPAGRKPSGWRRRRYYRRRYKKKIYGRGRRARRRAWATDWTPWTRDRFGTSYRKRYRYDTNEPTWDTHV